MKIAFISDMHNKYKRIEFDFSTVDVLCVMGDISGRGEKHEIRQFNNWCGKLPLPKERIIVISGNHDWFYERTPRISTDSLCIENYATNYTYLQDEAYEIDGVKFYGSPHTPYFYGWAFNVPRGKQLAEIWAKIPDDTDILLTHGPPWDILDKNREGDNCGCEDLLTRVKDLKPKIHAFGHIHEAHGMVEIDGTTFINGSLLNRDYHLVYEPTIVEVG